MDLEELRVYKRSMELGDKVWVVVDNWSWFQKDTVGKQLVRAVDSIAANLRVCYEIRFTELTKVFCPLARRKSCK